MKLLNSIFDYLLQAWAYFFGTMMNFKTAYPTLSLFVFLGLLVALVYLLIQSFQSPKPKYKTFDIQARVEDPKWYTIGIQYVIERGLLLPFFAALEFLVATIINVVFGLYIFGMKVYFYFQLKRIRSSKN